MDKTDFTKAMKELEEFYGRNLSAKATEVWWLKLRFLDKPDLWAAVEGVTAHERQMPTPGVFLKYADEARARRATREREKDRIQAREFFQAQNHNSQLAKDSVEFVQMLMQFRPGSVEKAQFEIDWTRGMAAKYPHLAGEYRKHEEDARKRLVVAQAMQEAKAKRKASETKAETQEAAMP